MTGRRAVEGVRFLGWSERGGDLDLHTDPPAHWDYPLWWVAYGSGRLEVRELVSTFALTPRVDVAVNGRPCLAVRAGDVISVTARDVPPRGAVALRIILVPADEDP